MDLSIRGITAYMTRLPLIRPYHLSLGSLEAYDSVFVRIQAGEKEGFGEVTDCPGYFTQGLSDAWQFVCSHGPEIPGKDPESALKSIIDKGDTFSFAATPLVTALESLIRSAKETLEDSARIPILGVVQGETPETITAEVKKLLGGGYRTLKFKVGFSVAEDLARVRHLQSQLLPETQVRLDANQGYDYSQAHRFLEGLDPQGIELLEQPLDPGAWDDMARLASMSPVPLMLDESIAGEEDLDRAIEASCARAVKFKLMKCGSFAHLEKMIKKATGGGLKVILGNGVATDISCLHEALIAYRLGLSVHAGEMNGFLKGSEQFLDPKLIVAKGDLILPSEPLKVRWRRLSQYAVKTRSWGDVKTPG